jgi:hypothetical protein
MTGGQNNPLPNYGASHYGDAKPLSEVREGLMRWILLLTLLLLSGCYYPYGYYPYGYYGYGVYPYAAQQPYYGAAPYYGSGETHSYGQAAAPDPNNCGTPDEPKSCYHAYH